MILEQANVDLRYEKVIFPGKNISGLYLIWWEGYFSWERKEKKNQKISVTVADLCWVISLPTLILAECVLIYLDPGVSRAVIDWTGHKFPTSIFVVYEQVGLCYILLSFRQCSINNRLIENHKFMLHNRFTQMMRLDSKCWGTLRFSQITN